MNLQDARTKIDAWRRFYNEARLHRPQEWLMPNEFALKKGFKPVLQTNNEPEILTSELQGNQVKVKAGFANF